MRFDQQFFKTVIPDTEFIGKELSKEWEISVNSREIQKGELFLALKGPNFDGHDFIQDAIDKGATGIIINQDKKSILNSLGKSTLKNILVAIVSDTKKALIDLASAWRSQFTYPVIGIGGSVGKTSTKEILSNILTVAKMPYTASLGNQNTEIGVSLNILRMKAEHKAAIIEMGVSKRGEMARLAKIVRPTSAIITFIGHSHMEGLGSITDIAHEKRDIFKYFKESNIGIVNGDQSILANISYTHPIVKFGCKTTNQIQARKVQANNSTHFILKLYKEKYKIVLDTNHNGRVMNSLGASAVAYLLDVSHEAIVEGIQMSLSISGRFSQESLKASKGLVINDSYNASPESMKAALIAFEKVESKGQKIAILGDMLELGVNSAFWHRQLGRFLRKVPSLSHVILVGSLVKWTKNTIPLGLSFEHVDNWQEASKVLQDKLDSDKISAQNNESVILIKGSRGLQLNNLVEELV